jgi:23S rRNA (adenine2503-C2)-methyltransferase
VSDTRIDLLGLPPVELRTQVGDFLRARREPAYRADQVARWIYGGEARSIDEMTNLSRELRAALATTYRLAEPEIERVSRSQDGTAKHLWRLPDGELVESVLIPAGDRLTLCVSSQAGCAMGCTFCATGWSGFARQLTAGEIVAQYRASRRWAAAEGYPPISNIVFMGMGEPLYNLDNVAEAIDTIADGDGISISRRRITVSTAGVAPKIPELGKRTGAMLAISLHATNDDLRNELVPLNKKYNLKELFDAIRAYPDLSNSKRVTFEYVMLKGVNDTLAEAKDLVRLLKGVPAKINLIPFNPWPGTRYECSDWETIEAFAEILNRAGYASPIRTPRGRDILAACGQLRSESVKEKASERLKKRLAEKEAQ